MKNLLLIFECKVTPSCKNTQIFWMFFCFKNFRSGKIVRKRIRNRLENRERIEKLSKMKQKSARL